MTLSEDPALNATARAILDRVRGAPEHRTPGAQVIQALAWRAGVIDPIPAVVVTRRGPGADRSAAQEGLRALLRSDRPTHLGAASTTIEGDELVVLTFAQRRVRLDAPRDRYALGQTLLLRGALTGEVEDPTLILARPDGTTRETRLAPGRAIEAEVPLDARGAWQVEVMARSPQGATVVANFPVYVDVAPPPVPSDETRRESSDPIEVARELRRLLAAARRAAGLAPLGSLDVLERVADAHSTDMARNGFVAHVSPTTGGHDDRLRAAGFVAGLALENVARGYGAREIHDGLMSSPGHRANLLDRRVTHVGVAVAREPRGAGLLATQLFVEVPRAVDPAAESARLLASLNALRRAAGAVELRADHALTAAAQQAAGRFFSEPAADQRAIFEAAARSVQRATQSFRRVSVAGALGPSTEGAERAASLLEPELRAVGVGVAQGDRPNQPARSVLTVFVTAVPR